MLFLTCLFLHSCNVPEAYLKRENYDAAFQSSANRLDRKKQKTKHVVVFEKAFAQANERDISEIENLKIHDSRKSWEQIHFLHAGLRLRHDKMRELVPIASEEGYRPVIKSYPVEDWENESFERVVQLYLAEIREKLLNARLGNRYPAREAYFLINELERKYVWSGIEKSDLIDSCYLLGTEHVLLNIEKVSRHFNVDKAFHWLDEWEMELNHQWRILHRIPDDKMEYDYVAQLEIDRASVSPGQRHTDTEYVCKEIEVGKKEIRDTSGKVVDYEPILKEVSATIVETTVEKRASVEAVLIIWNAFDNQAVFKKRICGTDYFSDSACDFYGDERAVNVICSGGFYSSLDYFPPDEEMLWDATQSLRDLLLKKLKKFNGD